MQVSAFDAGDFPQIETVQVTVTITDENDNSPVMTEYPFKVDVSSTAPRGHTVGQVQATDTDAGQNAELTYRCVRLS